MKRIVQIHGWVVDRCLNIYNKVLGYEDVLDSFYKSNKPVKSTPLYPVNK